MPLRVIGTFGLFGSQHHAQVFAEIGCKTEFVVNLMIVQRQRYLFQRVEFGFGDVVALQHLSEHNVAALPCALVAAYGIEQCRIFAHAHQRGRLFDGQIFGQFAEIDLCGCFDADGVVQKIEFVPDSRWEFVISSSRAKPSMIEFIKKFPNYGFNQASGLGNKAVEVILKDNVYFATGVSSVGYWDVCAADCISREIGGGFYDFEGNDIQYEEKREYINKVLFMVSSDTKKKGFIDMVKKHNFYSF